MPKPLGTKIASAHFDNKAAEHSMKAADFAALADKAKTPASRVRYNRKAQQERQAAIDCLERAKLLDRE